MTDLKRGDILETSRILVRQDKTNGYKKPTTLTVHRHYLVLGTMDDVGDSLLIQCRRLKNSKDGLAPATSKSKWYVYGDNKIFEKAMISGKVPEDQIGELLEKGIPTWQKL